MTVKLSTLEFHDDRCLIRPAEELKTAGGIIIPPTKEEKPNYGTIMIAGEWQKGGRCPFRKGSKVMYGKYAGTEIDLINEEGKNETFLIVRMVDLIATINE